MISHGTKTPSVAIACGGTGGHLFPGLAVAAELKQRGCAVSLLVSPKQVDQEAVKSARELAVFTLPAVALQNRNYIAFGISFVRSLFAARKLFVRRRPDAVLAMGGFTAAPPIFAAKDMSGKTFLHESNTIPGRANRFLARFVDEAFVGFPDAAGRLRAKKVSVTGTPVRPEFQRGEAAVEEARAGGRPIGDFKCRVALGLDPNRPTVLVVGGSQGASGLNELVLAALPSLAQKGWQWLHLTGGKDFEKVQGAYAALAVKAVVKPFLAEMDVALGAATTAVSRAGASSLAELAAMRLPAVLVPYPVAADNHQFHNARAFEATRAARLLEQKGARPETLASLLCELMEDEQSRATVKSALGQWHAPHAAEQIAENILAAITRRGEGVALYGEDSDCGCGHRHAKHAH